MAIGAAKPTISTRTPTLRTMITVPKFRSRKRRMLLHCFAFQCLDGTLLTHFFFVSLQSPLSPVLTCRNAHPRVCSTGPRRRSNRWPGFPWPVWGTRRSQTAKMTDLRRAVQGLSSSFSLLLPNLFSLLLCEGCWRRFLGCFLFFPVGLEPVDNPTPKPRRSTKN